MFNFGKSTTTASGSTGGSLPTPSFSFGGASSTPATNTTSSTGGFSFGGAAASSTPAPAAKTGGFSFGGASTAAPTTTAPTLSFGGAAAATTTASTLSFGASTTSAPSSGFSLGGSTAPKTTASGFSLGGATATTSAAPATLGGTSGFSFGGASASTATTSTAATSTAPSLFSGTTTTAPSLFGGAKPGGLSFGATSTAATTAPTPLTTTTTSAPIGLGGAGYNDKKEAEKAATPAAKPIKDQHVNPEIVTLVTALESHIKKEKEESSEVAKFSQRQLMKIKENTASLELMVRALKTSLQKDETSVGLISAKASELQNHIEMAQRTNDTHPSHQYENHLPTKYFHDLAIEFERKLMIYRSQIDQLEAHLAVGGETALSELPMALEKIHQTYIALAAGVQIIITALEKVKQKYLNYRRQVRGDTSDPFLDKNKPKVVEKTGPSAFADLSNLSVLALAQLSVQNQQAQNQPPNTGFTSTANTGGGLFSNTNNTNSGGGLFGNTTSTGGGLFGNTASKPGGLFGNTSTNTGGSLFGNTTTSSTGGSLFGNTSTNNTGGGLFGNTANKVGTSSFSFGNNTSTPASGSLFGGASTTSAKSGGFSFGK
ncbi:Oidioi.mRNA.OKI2018_I69.chr1.g2918.t1.cds [Oikopleura dioica]|uniref:Oidioi.mRNA.OKI2018_I69.chr1.g2918.t1.cds n=1 Tax=Oikopleura dioica TaxID=34765 RepID=A0ABN7SSJ2_OIKDI|nr:Oidioi.mRNA.OKI2018_I69.chr1.g2918.t1.cds [Oikopleura dioica]